MKEKNMEINNLKAEHKKIHFIGIGGISMSGLAEILHANGFVVSGSDGKSSDLTDHLKALGIEIFIGHAASNILPDVDLVVFTAAVKPDNEEYIAAENRGIKIIDRAYLLGIMMRDFKFPVCIAGTHGKTSTTSMIAQIFLTAGKDPTITLGGVMPGIDSNFRLGSKDFFVVEACEYCNSFLKFYPYVGVILNVDADHLDYFKDITHIENSFHSFAQNISSDGFLVINRDIPGFETIVRGLACETVTFGGGETDARWRPAAISYDCAGHASFDVIRDGKKITRLDLKLRGRHNILNALAAYAVADGFDIEAEYIKEALESCRGAKRRFETKGEVNGVTVIDDYAHHPTEIKATLAAARNCNYGRIICAFQPHTYTRTQMLFKEMASAFDDADQVIILDIYSAREKDTGLIHAKDLAAEISRHGKDTRYFSTFDDAKKFLSQNCIPNDLLITMGAGDVYLLGEQFLEG